MSGKLAIAKLHREHSVDAFDCGKEALNRFLALYALQNQQMGASQTYVALAGDVVVGYYTLVFGQVAFADAPERLQKGMAQHPVSLMVLARLAVATGAQDKKIGSGLLKDAIRRTLQAADIAGLRALAVHAKDEDARGFYEHFNFMASPTNPMHLFVLIKDAKALVRR